MKYYVITYRNCTAYGQFCVYANCLKDAMDSFTQTFDKKFCVDNIFSE